MSRKSRKRPIASPAATAGDAPAMEAVDTTISPACPLVAIGASAGGLDPLKELFASLPADTGAAFVVIMHLDPNFESLAAQILGRSTAMPVSQVTPGTRLEADHVYVIPPKAYLTLSGRTFQLKEPVAPHGVRMPIDAFLSSLAEDQQQKTVAIILSGTGSDGTLGLRAVKGHGGLVMVQAPESAQYEGMPRSAIATAQVDLISRVDAMAGPLSRYLHHPYVRKVDPGVVAEATDQTPDPLRPIFDVLRSRTGYDFTAYKRGTVGRRIARRMGFHNIDSVASYIKLLDETPDEATRLLKDLSIGVTAFFRDAEAFQALDTEVLAKIVEQKATDEPIRVWVPGCSTGEEAYSVGMLLMERVEAAHKRCPLLLFASDRDETALAVARRGVYPEGIVADVSDRRVRRFFTKEDHAYRVSKALREAVIFSTQDLIGHPPFSKLDLISCRNLLIYLEAAAQRQVMGLFHFALQPRGFLFLGESETVGQESGLFKPVVKHWRIYQRSAVSGHLDVAFPRAIGKRPMAGPMPQAAAQPSGRHSFEELIRRELLADYAPAALLTDHKHQVVYFHGPTVSYLERPTGVPTQALLSLVRQELRPTLRQALRRAAAPSRPTVVAEAHVIRGKSHVPVRVTVRAAGAASDMYLITFRDLPEHGIAPVANKRGAKDTLAILLKQQEHELKITREELQRSIEEHESATQELQAANEEVLSTNEELETSTEELQSINEELMTVNGQLKTKVDELAAANDDLANLLRTTDIATLFIDTALNLRRFTPTAAHVMRVTESSVGRPISEVPARFSGVELAADARQVLKTLAPVEREVSTDAGVHFLYRALPFQTTDHRVDGIVITFTDITQRKRAERNTRRLAALVRDSNDAITVQEADGRIVAWNQGAERMYGWSEGEALAMNMVDIVPDTVRAHERLQVERILHGESVPSIETQRLTKDGRRLEVWLTMTGLTDEFTDAKLVATTERDVTERLRTQADSRSNEAKFRAIFDSGADAMLMHDENGLITMANAQASQLLGYRKDELTGMTLESLMPERFRAAHADKRRTFMAEGSGRAMGVDLDLFALTKDGREIPIEVALSPIETTEGVLGSAIMRDVSVRKLAQQMMVTANERMRSASAAKSRFLATASHDLRQPLQSLALLNATLLRVTADPKAQQILSMQGEALASMSRLLGSLLNITKLESGTISPAISDFPIRQVFEHLAANFSAEADEKGLELRFVASPEIAHTDPGLLSQLLQNLVANAVRYTKKGYVEVRCIREDAWLRCEVEDSGIGIPGHELKAIFEEFHQVGDDPHERREGLGLGLAIVQRIADLLETHVEVQSEIGRGSTFSITVPAGRPEAIAPPQAKAARPRHAVRACTVLLLDDDAAVLAASKMLLELEGFTVVTASSGAGATARLNDLSTVPDIIVTDYHLGRGESGLDIVRAARVFTGRPIPAVLVTGDTSRDLVKANVENLQILSKPIDVDDLLAAIGRARTPEI